METLLAHVFFRRGPTLTEVQVITRGWLRDGLPEEGVDFNQTEVFLSPHNLRRRSLAMEVANAVDVGVACAATKSSM